MSEIVTSALNKNSLLYGSADAKKNFGPDCVDGKGEDSKKVEVKPAEAPVKAVRQK